MKKPSVEFPTNMFDAAMERCVIANILRRWEGPDGAICGGDKAATFLGLMSTDDFSIRVHRFIFERASEVHQSGKDPSAPNLVRLLLDRGELHRVNGFHGLMQIDEEYVELVHPAPWAANLRRLGLNRRVYGLSQSLQAKAELGLGLAADEIAAIDRELRTLEAPPPGAGTVAECVADIGGLDALSRQQHHTITFPSCLPTVNHVTNGGMERGQFWLVAARPSVGKSTLALQTAVGAARKGVSVEFYSLEMGKTPLLRRLFAAECGISHSRIVRNELDADDRRKIAATAGELDEAPLAIFTDRFGLAEILAGVRQRKPGLVVIDYLGLVETNRRADNRVQEISYLTRQLKLCAQELGCVVLALSQLSRAGEAGGKSRTPVLSDLRDSGSLEQDADGVLLLHDPEAGEPVKRRGRMVKLICAKQREGLRDLWVDLHLQANFCRFVESTSDGTTQ